MDAREYVILSNSASKRALFPSYTSPKPGKSDDEDSLGHMSPLRSSPDRYSSPPPSPCWVGETPVKATQVHDEDLKSKETALHVFRNLLSSVNKSTPLKEFTNIIKSTPEKDCETGTLTPLKYLIQQKNIEETPDSVTSRRSDASKKLCWKKMSQFVNSPQKDEEKKNFDFNGHTAKLIKNSFYRPTHSRAKTSLFPESVSVKRPLSVTVVPKISHLNATYPGHHHRRSRKRPRVKRGEINAGVCHKVKRPKLILKRSLKTDTISKEKPVISPEDRIQRYVVDNNLLDRENTPAKRPKLNVEINEKPLDGNDQLVSLKMLYSKGSPVVSKRNDSSKNDPQVEPVSDPSKKFFKTNRTMAIDHKATVTVVNNVKIQVHNGKLALDNSLKRAVPVKRKQRAPIESIFEEDPTNNFETNAVKETVQEVLQKLDDELEKSCPVEDSHHIQSITTSTSSLVLYDNEKVGTTEPEEEMDNLNSKENGSSTESPDDSKKLYPVFYKRKGLYDATNQRRTTPPTRKIRPLGDNQYQIDAGQFRFRAVHCKECGTLYHLGDPEDEIAHYNIHNNVATFRFMGWKNEHVIKLFPDGGRVIVVYPDDPKVWVNKAKEVLGTVDCEMGCVGGAAAQIDSNKVYLYILKNRIVGVLAAEPLAEAFRMINTGTEGPDCCSEETYSVRCGVSRVWVAPDQRRKRIATSLLDCLRLTFMFDSILAKQDIAFSVPTEQGKAFATNYMNTAEFMVYYK